MSKYYGYAISDAELQHISKIGVLCWGLIGDVFFRLPIIEALKARFPHAEITVIVDPAGKAVLKNHPDCNHVFVLARAKKPFYKYLVQTIRAILTLRNKRFDLFVNLYSGGSSPLITRLIGAKIRLGFDYTRTLRLSNNLLVPTPYFCQHWAKALGQILEPLGIAEDKIRRGSSFFIPDDALHSVEKFHIKKDQHIAINLGAGKKEKCWPVDKFVQLAQAINDKFNYTPVVFTNPGMEQLAHDFERQYSKRCIILPLLSLDEVAAIMVRCNAVITGDTSLMHLAIGLKVPNMVLFTDTRPEIVEPDDCIHVACFVEDESNINSCHLPTGTANIPVSYALQCFITLLSRIDKSL